MTPRSARLCVEDIHASIVKIGRYTEGMTQLDLEANDLVMDAVIRNLEIIGEAAGKVPDSVTARFPDIPWRRMSALRNIAIHEYFGVDPDIVWNVAVRDLPSITPRILEVLTSLDPETPGRSGA